jgi:hypothetical protein
MRRWSRDLRRFDLERWCLLGSYVEVVRFHGNEIKKLT